MSFTFQSKSSAIYLVEQNAPSFLFKRDFLFLPKEKKMWIVILFRVEGGGVGYLAAV